MRPSETARNATSSSCGIRRWRFAGDFQLVTSALIGCTNINIVERWDFDPPGTRTTFEMVLNDATLVELTRAFDEIRADDAVHCVILTGGEAQARDENALVGGLRRLFAVAEDYPDLKASQNFLALQEELTSTENRIGFARQHYNDSVMTYNTRIQKFPDNPGRHRV